MKKTAQSSTQAFTEIIDIRERIVLLKNNTACIILQVNSVNFSLLSKEEQDSRVAAYAGLLNSLSFPIQIAVRSKPVDITPYINSIEAILKKPSNTQLSSYIARYKEFVSSLVKISTVLDKQFYIIISYSGLEAGATSVLKQTANQDGDMFFEQAKVSLETRSEELLAQVHRMSLQAKVLEKDALIKLFYDIYNQGQELPLTSTDLETSMVKGSL